MLLVPKGLSWLHGSGVSMISNTRRSVLYVFAWEMQPLEQQKVRRMIRVQAARSVAGRTMDTEAAISEHWRLMAAMADADCR